MKKVKANDKFNCPAGTWNKFIDAALYVQQQQDNMQPAGTVRDTKPGVVLVNNQTGSALEQFAIVSLGTSFYLPTNGEQKFRNNTPVFTASALSDANKSKPFAITQAPLKDGRCGLATVSGIIPAKVTVSDASHEYAALAATGLVSASSGLVRILWKASGTGEQWAIVQLGAASAGGQSAIPAVITSGNTLDGYLVAFYANGFDQAATSENQPCHVMDLAAYDNIPAGERVMALPLTVIETGDSE